MAEIFTLFARLWSEAAARNDAELPKPLARRMGELARIEPRIARVPGPGVARGLGTPYRRRHQAEIDHATAERSACQSAMAAWS